MGFINNIKEKVEQHEETTIQKLFQNNVVLDDNDIEQISSRFKAGFYSLALDYIWRKFRQTLKTLLSELGDKVINNQLFILSDVRPVPFASFEVQALQDMGIITKKERYELLKTYLLVQESVNNPSVVNEKALLKAVELCAETIFNKDLDQVKEKVFAHARDVETVDLSQSKTLYQMLTHSKKRYYASAIKYMIYIYHSSEHKDIIEKNLSLLVSNFWNDLKYEEKLQIGYWATNSEDSETKSLCKNLLNTSEELSYTSESKYLKDIINISKKVISAFYSYQNKTILADSLYELSNIENMPVKYSNFYIGACLLCATDDEEENTSNTSYVQKIFEKMTDEKWQYYLNFCFTQDNNIMFRLYTSKIARTKMFNFISTFNFENITITNDTSKKLLIALQQGNHYDTMNIAKDLLY